MLLLLQDLDLNITGLNAYHMKFPCYDDEAHHTKYVECCFEDDKQAKLFKELRKSGAINVGLLPNDEGIASL